MLSIWSLMRQLRCSELIMYTQLRLKAADITDRQSQSAERLNARHTSTSSLVHTRQPVALALIPHR